MTQWGPTDVGGGRWRFAVWAPDRQSVSLEIEGGATLSMEPDDDGWFCVETRASEDSHYRFRLAPDLAVPDPASRRQAGGVHGWSVVTPISPPATGWTGRPWEEAVIYELHVGLCGGFAGVADRLPGLAAIGITAIELMPVNSFSGSRNWGYDGVLSFAPAEAYGSPADLRALIDAAHDLGLMIFLDVVYNHFGPDGNYLGAYAAPFFHAERHTPWGGAVAVDRPPVAAFFRENALMWLNDYGFDGLRFDAVHAIGDDAFLDALAHDLRAATPGRHIHLMLENERNDAGRLGPRRYDAQWNDDFHNVMHVLLTGERDAYYEDFAERPAHRLARCLMEGFIYQGDPSPHQQGKLRGTPSAHLPPSAFIAFLQNHDQTGNRALGERLIALTTPERLKAATTLLLLMPHIPLLFMGEEAGATSPFLFFTDFHDELADAVREGRRREFKGFAAFASQDARARIPDPNARETFDMGRIVEGPDAAEWRRFYKTLLALRHRAIVPGIAGAHALEATVLTQSALQAVWRLGDGHLLSILLNLGDLPVDVSMREKPAFAAGTPGGPASCAVWIDLP
ncbi:malto-oligosyltrehalose trehalohydrolase [Sphingobium yanoikuyae]|jgi:maltooligosyltrehalose trehalohydrolase|uniref:malto-oligosyltrehalose trehalohydrolase n=1 Tax=Sphingobium yanoikuyae TaxID=13690 RepID=UPI0004E38F7F|nr:malto-oligosyltrehalose trehalohydrolase [Sphingobium yanoikuyae]KFD30061.1 malto-oligosyltrehalose trehalohydrolase [Sphingobium yanoikuyae]MDV3477921.1 malto-oligosyltrehalose trehalohydrolase [Sphingobium yanoikuyae]